MTQRPLASEESSVGVTAYPAMSEEEAREVIDLWTARQMPSGNRPTVRDLAEGLDISPTDAAQLLTEIRNRRIEEAQREAQLREAEAERAEATARLAEAEARQAEANARKRQAEQTTISTAPPRFGTDEWMQREAKALQWFLKTTGILIGFILIVFAVVYISVCIVYGP